MQSIFPLKLALQLVILKTTSPDLRYVIGQDGHMSGSNHMLKIWVSFFDNIDPVEDCEVKFNLV